MPDIKLRDGSGVENTYTGVDTITLPLADGTGTWTFGLTDEELKLDKFNNQYLFTGAPNNNIWSKYGHRIDASDVSNMQYIFTDYKNDDLDKVEITFNNQGSNNAGLYLMYAFQNCDNITKLPTFNNLNVSPEFTGVFSNCQNIDEAVQDFIDSIESVKQRSYNIGGSLQSHPSLVLNSCFYGCYKLKSIDFLNLNRCLQIDGALYSKTGTPSFSSFLVSCDEIESLLNIPVLTADLQYIIASNFLGNGNMPNENGRLTHITFATNNGVPYKANWKNQTLDLGYYSASGPGWETSNFTSVGVMRSDYYNIADSPDSSATLEGTQARYRAKKDAHEDDWCIYCGTKKVTYDSKSLYLSELFSRFNHDSAVELINSLPDTSEYLATAGGTNTIKFHGYSGALTDEGAINTLTAAEIQVATDKGWTVTFVD